MKDLTKTMKEELQSIDKKINSIIDYKKENMEEIEKILDVLLEYGQFGCGVKSFARLNNYYKNFMPDNAETYNIWFERHYGFDY